MPWTELDYLVGPNTCVPLLKQLRAEFPEVQAVNAMCTHGMAVIISNLSVNGLAPAASPAGISSRMIIDATTPVAPDTRGHFAMPVRDLPETGSWIAGLRTLLAARQAGSAEPVGSPR